MTPVGRPREFDEQEVLEAALEVFWCQGFEATSKRDLMEATGIASQSLYNAFGDKRSLFLRALRHYGERQVVGFERALEAKGTAIANLRGYVRSLGGPECDDTSEGCFLCNTAAEFGQHDDEVSAFVGETQDRMHEVLLRALKRAKRDGDLPRKADLQAIAAALMCVAHGVALWRRSGASQGQIDHALDGLMGLLSA